MPLRFHHQDIHDELDKIKDELRTISNSLQKVQQGIDELNKDKQLRMPQSGNDLW